MQVHIDVFLNKKSIVYLELQSEKHASINC